MQGLGYQRYLAAHRFAATWLAKDDAKQGTLAAWAERTDEERSPQVPCDSMSIRRAKQQ